MKKFDELAAILAAWPAGEVDPSDFEVSAHARLASALQNLREAPNRVGVGDLAGLVRHVLRRESLLRRDPDLVLTVPVGEDWPDPGKWKSFGMDVSFVGDRTMRIRGTPWMPGWLDALTPAEPAFREDKRRAEFASPADPRVLELTGYSTYASPGQRAAVRTAFLMPEGHTLVVNLPTGAGKSLVFQAPALAAAAAGKMSIIVVPTTALARDQEVRIQKLLTRLRPDSPPLPMAYYTGLPAEAREAFRGRVRTGHQPVVIASPESLVGSLWIALTHAARAGRIAWFVVDEAHIVSAWGNDFRPEFQLLSGLRDSLRSAGPTASLRTLLLSATLTPDAIQTLASLFGPDRFDVLSAVHLRPEPDYYVAGANDPCERKEWVSEVLRHAPRPILVYVSRRDDAVRWESHLNEMGFRRVASVRGGDMATPRGLEILRAWSDRSLDVIVATSAFGLGMDQADVRTVIHACIPETIDRYYQEVGRGGRDGRASLSFLLHAPEDRPVARKLGRQKIIGLRKGPKRWRAMWATRERLADVDDGWMVSLDARWAEIQEDNDANVGWNVRTLILMARAGLLRIGSPPTPNLERLPEESAEDFEARWKTNSEKLYHSAAVRILESAHLSEATWRSQVDRERRRSLAADVKAMQFVDSILEGREPLNRLFRDAYSLPAGGVVPSGPRGSCPATRRTGVVDHHYRLPIPNPVACVASIVQPPLRNLSGPGPHWVAYQSTATRRREEARVRRLVTSFLQRSISLGVTELALPQHWIPEQELVRLSNLSPMGFLIVRGIEEVDSETLDGYSRELPLARVSLLPPSAATAPVPSHLLDVERPFHLIILPAETPDRDRPDRSFIATGHYEELELLLARCEA